MSYVFTDVDECNEGMHNCTYGCINTNGSFICACQVGYEFSEDRTSCQGTYIVHTYMYTYKYMCLHFCI